MADEQTPPDLRAGVRAGILAAVERDAELRGGRTARLLAAAGALGVLGAVGITLMVSGHPFGHHPPWHVVVVTATWSGLLIVSLALAFLGVRTPSLPLARAACTGIIGLGVAGLCGAACPDQHFLEWWAATDVGGKLKDEGGLALAALCLGLVSSLFFGLVSAIVGMGSRLRIEPALPAAMLLLLLSPGIALQSFGTSWSVFASWLLGSAGGVYGGVALAARARASLRKP